MAVVVTEVMPRRLIRVTSWLTAEVTDSVAVRAFRSQSKLWIRIRPRARTPVIVPFGSWSGSAGRISSTPGRL